MTDFSPREIVSELDRFIVGQADAKRAVSIALRNRWRRLQLAGSLREEVLPKNILMIGPTGVGKTEIARRLAKLAAAPFLKVEATKFTEVGYVGRDVEQIVRDLVEVAIAQTRERKRKDVQARAQLAELQTQLAKAERDLEFTKVRAPVDGTFSNRLVNTGDYINVGQRLGNVVPLAGVFIDANYKETQLKRIRTGQRVTIKVDAYGFRKFTGIVDSISPAAGSVFTLLPPDNATGNFTKIVQRLPVRIRVPDSVAKQGLLRAGMSVYTTVDTSEGAADADADTDLDSPMMIHPQ